MTEKVLFSWSGGKDCALALYKLQEIAAFEVAALLTTITKDYDRISMHGVKNELLEQQADALGLPLEKVFITKESSNDDYECKMRRMLEKHSADGVSAVVFGDIFLQDLRDYRQNNLAKINMKAFFPLWKQDTTELAHEFIDLGFKAIITCVDTNLLDKKFTGRDFDRQLLSELPDSVNPCGENGEFHTFVYDGPIFQQPIPCEKGAIVLRENRFSYCDLLPLQTASSATGEL